MTNKNSLFSALLLISIPTISNASAAAESAAKPAAGTAQRTPLVKVIAGVPGILSLFQTSPDTANPMSMLAEELLVKRATPQFPRGDRELVASLISNKNKCKFCTNSHSAAAAAQLKDGAELVEAVKKDFTTAQISPKMKALLAYASKVHTFEDGTAEAAEARKHGADDLEIHDTCLIASAFNMYNRYVDGLRSFTPTEPQVYVAMGKHLADNGYMSGKPTAAAPAPTQTGK
jgi:uncharacterized peroxidase-related enzyme